MMKMVRVPICVGCHIDMVPIKNDFVVEIMAGAQPYQKIMADQYGCPNCSFRVVVGFAVNPLAEYWQDEYDLIKADLKAWGSAKDRESALAKEAH